MNDNKKMLLRAEKFMSELGVSSAALARNIGSSASSIYKWRYRDIELSEKMLKRIDEYLKRYNF